MPAPHAIDAPLLVRAAVAMTADFDVHRLPLRSRVLRVAGLCLLVAACRGQPALPVAQTAEKLQLAQTGPVIGFSLGAIEGGHEPARHSSQNAVTERVWVPSAPTMDNSATEQPPGATVAIPKRIHKFMDLQVARSHPALKASLPAAVASALRLTGVPALLPENSSFLDAVLPVGHPDWYSLSSTYAGITVVVQGDSVATVDPEMAPADWQPPTWQAPLVTRNEGIVEATFLAWGASYVVSIECADPAQDRRCTEDAELLTLVQSLRRWPSQPGEAP